MLPSIFSRITCAHYPLSPCLSNTDWKCSATVVSLGRGRVASFRCVDSASWGRTPEAKILRNFLFGMLVAEYLHFISRVTIISRMRLQITIKCKVHTELMGHMGRTQVMGQVREDKGTLPTGTITNNITTIRSCSTSSGKGECLLFAVILFVYFAIWDDGSVEGQRFKQEANSCFLNRFSAIVELWCNWLETFSEMQITSEKTGKGFQDWLLIFAFCPDTTRCHFPSGFLLCEEGNNSAI